MSCDFYFTQSEPKEFNSGYFIGDLWSFYLLGHYKKTQMNYY